MDDADTGNEPRIPGRCLKSYSKKELADLYDVSLKTLRKWLKPHWVAIGCYAGKRFTPLQVEIIFKKLRPPASIADELEE